MPSAIVVTVGDASANSYATRAEGNTYFGDRLHASAWSSATDANKDAALLWAAKLLDRSVQLNGTRATATQALNWPRDGMEDESGNPIANTVVPQVVKDVQCELAILLLSSDRSLENQASAQGLTSLKAGPVSLAFKDKIKVNIVPDTLIAMFPVSWLGSTLVPYPLVVS